MKIGAVRNGRAGIARHHRPGVEALGMDSLPMFDHVVGAEPADRNRPLWGPYTEKDPFQDPFTAFAYLVGKTTGIGFMPGIFNRRNADGTCAKQAADLDLLSQQRFTMGVGTGRNYVE